MSSSTTVALIGAGAVLVGAGFGAWINHRLSVRRHRQLAFEDERRNFFAQLSRTVEGIRNAFATDPDAMRPCAVLKSIDNVERIMRAEDGLRFVAQADRALVTDYLIATFYLYRSAGPSLGSHDNSSRVRSMEHFGLPNELRSKLTSESLVNSLRKDFRELEHRVPKSTVAQSSHTVPPDRIERIATGLEYLERNCAITSWQVEP